MRTAQVPQPLRCMGELVLPPLEAYAAAVGGGVMTEEKALPQCPFYISHEGTRLRCEGLWKGSVLCSEFQKQLELDGHMAVYCTSRQEYPQCPAYRLLWQNYEKGGSVWAPTD